MVKFFTRLKQSIQIMFACLLLGTPVSALEKDDLVAAFGSLIHSDAFYEYYFSVNGIPDHQKGLYRETLTNMFSNEIFIDALADRLVKKLDAANVEVNQANLLQMARTEALAAQYEWVENGMARLSPAQNRRLFGFMLKGLKELPAATCAGLFNETLSNVETQKAEIKLMSGLSDTEFRDYSGLSFEALMAEINDTPKVPKLTGEELQRADQVVFEHLIPALESHPNSETLTAVLNEDNGVTDEDICTTFGFVLETLLNIPGKDGDLVIQFLLAASE